MPLSLLLDEDDFRAMPSDLREALLRWYCGREPNEPAEAASSPRLTAAGKTSRTPVHVVPDESRRVTFATLVNAGLLLPGQDVRCRALKRQQREGKSKFIDGAKVLTRGTVGFRGKEFENPSTLAVAMVDQTGGEPTALNGFDYLFVRAGDAWLPLKNLRDRLLAPTHRRMHVLQGLVEDAKLMGLRTTPEDHERWLDR